LFLVLVVHIGGVGFSFDACNRVPNSAFWDCLWYLPATGFV